MAEAESLGTSATNECSTITGEETRSQSEGEGDEDDEETGIEQETAGKKGSEDFDGNMLKLPINQKVINEENLKTLFETDLHEASKEEIDLFIDACKAIAKEAEENPELLLKAPTHSKVRRINETEAARHPCLTG